MTADRWERRTGHIESDGFTLQYIVEGRGPTALVVGSALYYSRTFSQNLRSHLRLAFVDHRGFAPGNTCTDRERYRLELLLEDMELARERLDLGRVIVVGHSGHAFLALEYAKRYPDRVSHVVLLGAAPSYSARAHAAGERSFAEAVCPERKAALAANLSTLDERIRRAPEKAFITFCLAMGPKSWFDPHFDATPLWEGVEVNMTMFDYVWGRVFRDIDITRGLERLRAPVWIGLGRFDYLVPPAYLWEEVRERFPDLTLRVFDRSAHAPQLEEPEAFDAELLSWLQSKAAAVTKPAER
ncbi:MAG: alpha/beta hydrolase [Pseudomonadota bacterium]|nr:MAG: alpha/beta hydrolase [Pseudomonadota bacterium]